jgi:hypothetical protein
MSSCFPRPLLNILNGFSFSTSTRTRFMNSETIWRTTLNLNEELGKFFCVRISLLKCPTLIELTTQEVVHIYEFAKQHLTS